MNSGGVKTAPVDLSRIFKSEYTASREPRLVEPQPGHYLAIDGMGEPGGEAFQRRLGALYACAFHLRFALRETERNFLVHKLEGLWWGSRGPGDFSGEPPADWNWKLIIRVPDFIEIPDLRSAQEELRARGKDPIVGKVVLVTLHEGRSIQILHLGPYRNERESIDRMNEFAREHGLAFHGLHHEIYLSDFRKTAPEKLKTILRMPVVAGDGSVR